MKKLFFSVLFSFFLLSSLIALEHTSPFRNWYNVNYVTDMISCGDRLAIGSTRGFVIFNPQDSECVILNQSDGIIDNQINGIMGSDTDVFLLTPEGMTVLSLDTTMIRNISSSFATIEGELTVGLVKGDTVYFGTTQYLYVWDTDGNPYNPFNMNWVFISFRDREIVSLFIQNDSLYVGTDGGVCVVPNYSFGDTTQWTWNSVGDGLPDSVVTAIDSWGGEIWVGTENGIVSGQMDNWTLRNAGLSSSSDTIYGFHSSDTLWTATDDCPYFWDGVLTRWVVVNNGLSRRIIRGICSDTAGCVWIGIEGDGLAYHEDTLWSRIRLPGPSSSNFSDITIDENGEVWGVHYGGFVLERRARTITHFIDDGVFGTWEILNDTNELGLTGPIRWVDVDHSGNVWFGVWNDTNNIVKYSPPVQWDTFNLPLDNVIGSQFIDSQGNKWFSNFSSSVCRLSHDDVTWNYFTDENYFNFIVSFCEDYEGNIYFGSAQRGVSVQRTTGSLLKISGLPSEEAFDLALDRNGDILVGTTDGVAVVRDFMTVDHYTRANSGLLGDNIMDILVDWQGNKWFLIENQGVSVLRNTGEWDSLTPSDGLASSLILDDLDGLAYDTEKGYLWIATKDGISRYETGDTPSPPDIVNVGVYPNPFIPRIHQGVSFNRIPDNASLYIFSLSLRKVRTVDYIDERTHTAFWDGTDEDGELVESGIYLFVVEDPNGNSATGKIAIIR